MICPMAGPRRTLTRIENPGDARFLTWSCYRRLALFQKDRIKNAFGKRLAFLHEPTTFKLYAWVIMPDHVHLIVQPTGITVPALLRRLKPRFGRTVIERWRE